MSEYLLSQLTPIEFEEEPVEPRELRLSRLYAAAGKDTPDACWDEFTRLQGEFEAWAAPVRARLLGTQVAWTLEELRLAKEAHNTCNQLALVGFRIVRALITRRQRWEVRTRQAAARTLHLMAETLKWEACVAPRGAHDYGKPHLIMREAIAAGEQLGTVNLPHVSNSAGSTLESLYFRVMLLARFAGGALNARQVEILDAWILQWMRTINSVNEAPPGSPLRADLDGSEGLRRGAREDEGPALYLPRDAVEKAYRAVVAEFHEGRIVPAAGLASSFRIEEYVAVLDLVQDGLKASREPLIPRARRHPSGQEVELMIGLHEIGATGAAAVKCRKVRLNDESESGLGLEGSHAECAGVCKGEAVAIRREAGQPTVLGIVARSTPATAAPGSIVMGVRRLGVGVQEIEVTRAPGGTLPVKEQMLFVVGSDPGGREDGFLVSERDYMHGDQFSAAILGSSYLFRINRARERGRGWLLAGFEVVAARRAAPEAQLATPVRAMEAA